MNNTATYYKSVQTKIAKDKIELWFIGDIHLMSIACDKEKLFQTIQKIKKHSNAYWIGMGDYAELIYPGDPRMDYDLISPDDISDIRNMADIDIITEEKVKQILSPIKHRCLAILDGNHEYTRNKRLFSHFGKKLAQSFGAPYLGYEGYLILMLGKDNQIPVRLWLTHGFGGGRKWGSHIDRLREITESFDADIYCAAHNHDIGAFRGSIIRHVEDPENNVLVPVEIERLFIRTGSFRRRTNTSYEARAGYSLQPTGVPYIILEKNNDNIEMHAVI